MHSSRSEAIRKGLRQCLVIREVGSEMAFEDCPSDLNDKRTETSQDKPHHFDGIDRCNSEIQKNPDHLCNQRLLLELRI